MGTFMSKFPDNSAKEHRDAIQRQLDADSQRFKRECKVLVMGTRESGKTTVVKQMKIIHQGGFDHNELMQYRPIAYRNLLDSAQAVLLYMQRMNLECEKSENQVLAEQILKYKLSSAHPEPSPNENPYQLGSKVNQGLVFDPSIADAIHQVWTDPTVCRVMEENRGDFYLMDNAIYFFAEAIRIGEKDYVPNIEDVLRVQEETDEIIDTRFSMGQLSIHMLQFCGHPPDPKKWNKCFESVTSIIFCASLSDYYQACSEETGQNRVQESLSLFESIINSPWFHRTSVILLLTKVDVLKLKINEMSLERYFPGYTGGQDVNKVAKYILWQYMQFNRAKLSVYPHLTEVMDSQNIKLVFAALKETILQNALKDEDIL